MNLHVYVATKNFFDTTVETEKGSFVYGHPYVKGKLEVWEAIKKLNHWCNKAWCCIGDFNDVRFNYEKQGGNPIDASRAWEFNKFISGCNLFDLPIQGGEFTWADNRDNKSYVMLDGVIGSRTV